MKRMALAAKNSKLNGSSRNARRAPREKCVVVALCLKKGGDCGDLHLATLYPVLPDRAAAKEGYLRVIDDSGEDYLYPAGYFVLRRLPLSLAKRIRQRL
jgi:hypothetical protein